MSSPKRPTTAGDMMTSGNISKAGLPTDKQAINAIIASSTNPHYASYQERRSQKTDRRAGEMQEKLKAVRDWALIRGTVDSMLARLHAAMDPAIASRTEQFVHLDMDAFFAACEIRDDPSLADVPMAVGGAAMLSTSNYAARKFGVVSAMPGYIALKLCPQLRLVAPNFEKYRRASAQVEFCLEELTGQPDVMLSIDEACFRVTGENVEAQVEHIRRTIHERTQLTCTCGIAPTRALAKGQWRSDFYHKLPAHKVSGIGKVTATLLKRVYDVETIGDLYRERYRVFAGFTSKQAEFLLAVSVGLQGAFFSSDDDCGRKSCSVERTFLQHPHFTSERDKIVSILKELAEMLSEDLCSKDLQAKTISVKWKTIDFEIRQRSVTVDHGVQAAARIMPLVLNLLVKERADERVRLLGLRASNFVEQRTSQETLRFQAKEAGDKIDLRCPICDATIARVVSDDPRIDLLTNTHIDRCLADRSKRARR